MADNNNYDYFRALMHVDLKAKKTEKALHGYIPISEEDFNTNR